MCPRSQEGGPWIVTAITTPLAAFRCWLLAHPCELFVRESGLMDGRGRCDGWERIHIYRSGCWQSANCP